MVGEGEEYILLVLVLYKHKRRGEGVLYIGRYSFLEGFAFVWVGHGGGGFLRFCILSCTRSCTRAFMRFCSFL